MWFFPRNNKYFALVIKLFFVIEGGNLTTEFTLPLQFLAIFLATKIFSKHESYYKYWLFIGFLGGLVFFTKQTAIGIWIAIMLFLAINEKTKF